jgi:putative peptide zinc metalloprotease protein
VVGLVMADTAFDPLSSPEWHRVADWRPRLREGVTVSRLWQRGQRWHVLRDAQGGPGCRLDPPAYEIAGRLDGRRSLRDLCATLSRHTVHAKAPDPPTQEDVIAVVTTLQQHGLIAFDGDAPQASTPALLVTPWPALTMAASEADTSQHRPNSLLAWRLPLLNPTRLLDRLASLGTWLFSPLGAVLWTILFASLLIGLVLHAPSLISHAQTWLGTPRYLLLAALAYPLIKAMHELAHGLAVRRWGGSVREAGVTLMMLMPIPYVDASAAHGFERAWQRAMVSAAGILAELALAAIGLWVWRLSMPGLVQDLGFVVWLIAGVSTLLFNANPLQRLDGYHLLTDVMALPNLALRSRQWWMHALPCWLMGRSLHDPNVTGAPVQAPGEKPWLIAYAPLAWLWQLVLWSGMTWWLGGISTVLGILAGVLVAWQLLLKPCAHWARLLWQSLLWHGEANGSLRSPIWRRRVMLPGLALLALLLPWPDARLAQGIVWAPEQALVRPEVDGFVLQVHGQEGRAVGAGDLLLTLDNPGLRAEHQRTQAMLAQAEQGQFSQMVLDSSKAGQASDEVQRLHERLAYLDAQLDRLDVRAQRDGQLVLPQAQDLPGRYLKRGTLIGHVMPPKERPILRVAMNEQDMRDLRLPVQGVTVQPADRSAALIRATLLRDGGGAGMQLPSAALSREMGGDLPTDPADKAHLRTLKPVVLMDVRLDLPADQEPMPLGGRAWVRFDQGWSPPIAQAWRWVRHQVAERFNPAR